MKQRVVEENINTKKHFEEYYSNRDWRREWDGADLRLAKVMELMDKEYPLHLDVGCADGTFTKAMLTKFPQTEGYGLDISETVIEQAQFNCPNGNFEAGDAYNLPYEDNFFDLVHSAETVEHLEEPERAIAEFYRVLKPFGTLIITVPNEHATPYEEHLWKWDKYGVREIIKSVMNKEKLSGFDIIEERPNFFNGHILYVKCIKNSL